MTEKNKEKNSKEEKRRYPCASNRQIKNER